MRLPRRSRPERGRAGAPLAEGLESVWDYPRPPRLEREGRRIRVEFGGCTIADTSRAFRVLETGHPPTYYLPWGDVLADCLVRSQRSSYCKWKGMAHYFDVTVGGRAAADAAWGYHTPNRAFARIADYVAFYPGSVDRCLVDDMVAEPQPGGAYGGWITPELVGPFKGGPGTQDW